MKYQLYNGTSYHVDTPQRLMEVLDTLRENRTRITIDYGDTATKESWHEVYDITGHIGRSTGDYKIPLLIKTSRSYGGGAILDNCILSIRHANKKNGGIIYQL